MVSGNLSVLWHHSYLVQTIWFDVSELLSTIKLVTSLLEVLLHHVDVGVVVIHVNSGVSDEKNTKFMEALCHFLALLFSSSGQALRVLV